MALTKYKLKNVENVHKLYIGSEKREVPLTEINDELAEKMYNRGSRYIEKIEDSKPSETKKLTS